MLTRRCGLTDDLFEVWDAGSDHGPIPPRPCRGIPTIVMSAAPVPRRGADELGEIWWQGRQWAVTADGIECRDGAYFVAKERVLENPAYPIPRHMAVKEWVDIDDFATAWLVAILLHGHARKITPKALLALFRVLPPGTL
jgi:hypothetical protein